MYSTHINRRFLKDYNIPIPVAEPEYLQYYLDLYDNVYHTNDLYEVFSELVDRLGDEEAFFVYGKKVCESAIEKMKNAPAYIDFINDKTDLFKGHKWSCLDVPKGQVYKEENDGKYFISIDLVKANYQALRYYTRTIIGKPQSEDDLVLGTTTFDQFISHFTNEEYYKGAKKFRQVVFGNINPKRQQTIQRYIIEKILLAILDSNLYSKAQLKDYTSDEIVFISDSAEYIRQSMSTIDNVAKTLGVDIHLDGFKLVRLNPYDFYVREMFDGAVSFKCIESSLMPQAIKHYFGINTLNDKDLTFYNSNGLLARYINPLW